MAVGISQGSVQLLSKNPAYAQISEKNKPSALPKFRDRLLHAGKHVMLRYMVAYTFLLPSVKPDAVKYAELSHRASIESIYAKPVASSIQLQLSDDGTPKNKTNYIFTSYLGPKKNKEPKKKNEQKNQQAPKNKQEQQPNGHEERVNQPSGFQRFLENVWTAVKDVATFLFCFAAGTAAGIATVVVFIVMMAATALYVIFGFIALVVSSILNALGITGSDSDKKSNQNDNNKK